MMVDWPVVSVVLPCFNEADNIGPLVSSLRSVDIGRCRMEVVLVDDGSTDRTWEEILHCAALDDSVQGVRLSRNFGQQAALIAGMREASGDAVVTMDADRQHPAWMISQMVRLWQEGIEVVTTTRNDAPGAWGWRQTASKLFYKAFTAMTDLTLHPGEADFRLLDRRVADQIAGMSDPTPFLRGVVAWAGYRRHNLSYAPSNRLSGRSKYTLRKMVRLGLSGMMSFSRLPLRVIPAFGCTAAVAALVYCARALVRGDAPADGSAVLLAFVSFFGGLVLMQLGLMGEYLVRGVVDDNRPLYLVAERCSSTPSQYDPLPSPKTTPHGEQE